MNNTGSGIPDMSHLKPLEEKTVSNLGETTEKNEEFAAEDLEEEGLDNSYNCDSPYERSPSMSVAVDPVPKRRKRT